VVSAGSASLSAVIVSRHAPGFIGGVERSCALLASVLEERGLRVTTIWPEREPGPWIYRAGLGSLWLSRRAASDRRVTAADLVVTNGIFGSGFSNFVSRIHVFHGTLVEMAHADAVGLSTAERRAARLPRRELLRRSWGGGAAERLAARHATVVCVSESTADEVSRHYGVRADAVIPNGIDMNLFRPRSQADARARLSLPAGERLALFAGRLNASKGAGFLLTACERAGYRLMVAGPQGAPGALNLGGLAAEELSLVYTAADCVVLPSLYEACSYVLLEALACGVPVLTTRVGYVSSLLRAVPDYQTLCVEPRERDLAVKLHYLAETDTTGLIRRARAWVSENNSLKGYAARWNVLLDSVEASRPAGPQPAERVGAAE
jgi:glycosyltransferase involved in cell wall biosynthesis